MTSQVDGQGLSLAVETSVEDLRLFFALFGLCRGGITLVLLSCLYDVVVAVRVEVGDADGS
eukprot:12374460-Prorocentrum_lima.AAC.1